MVGAHQRPTTRLGAAVLATVFFATVLAWVPTPAAAQAVVCDVNVVRNLAIVIDPTTGGDDLLQSTAVDLLLDLTDAALESGQLDRVLVLEPPVQLGGSATVLADTAETGPDFAALRSTTVDPSASVETTSTTTPDFDAATWDALDRFGLSSEPAVPYDCSGVGIAYLGQHPAAVAAAAAIAQADLRGVSLGMGAIGEAGVAQLRDVARFDVTADVVDTPSLSTLSRLLPDPPVQRLGDVVDISARPTARWYLEQDRAPFLLQGYSSRKRVNVTVPQGWQPVGQSQLVLRYTSSELARTDSSLLVSVDGNPMFTELVGDGQNTDLISDASLPAGDFEVLLSTSTPLDFDNECIDPDHVGRWIEIDENAHLLSELEFVEPTINNFVSSIAQISGLTERPVTFILPENPALELIETVGILSVAINEAGTLHDVQVVVGDPPAGIDGPMIIVAAPDPGMAGAEVFVAENDGWPVLSISGPREAMVSAARAVNDRSFAPLLDVGRASVAASVVPVPPEAPSLFTLESMGFRDRTARGTGEQSMGYDFDLPIEWQPSEMRIRIVGSYAASLSTVDTDLNVSINGQTIGSTTLTDETGRIDTTIAVPPSTLRPGKNFLRFSADLGRIPLVCEGLSSTDRWFSIHSSTTVSVGHETGRNSLDLGDLPWTLAERGDAAALDLVLPDDATAADLRLAIQILTAIAEGGNGTSPRITTAASADRSRHLILLGAGADQPLLRDLSDSLTIDPQVGLPDRVGELRAETSAGSLEVLWSPWADRRVILAVTGADRVGVENAVRHLVDDELRSELQGQAMLVGATASEVVDLSLPGALAIIDDGSDEALAEYQDWLRDQVDAPFDPATGTIDLTTRRIFAGLIAFGLAVLAAIGLIRKRNGGGGHGHDSHGHDDSDDDESDGEDPGDDGETGPDAPDDGDPAAPSDPDPAPDDDPADDFPPEHDVPPAESLSASAADDEPAPGGSDREGVGESDAGHASDRIQPGAMFNGVRRTLDLPDDEDPGAEDPAQPSVDIRDPEPEDPGNKALLDLDAHVKDEVESNRLVIDLRRPGVVVEASDADLVAALTVANDPSERRRSVIARRLSRKRRIQQEVEAAEAEKRREEAEAAAADADQAVAYLSALRNRFDRIRSDDAAEDPQKDETPRRSPIDWNRSGGAQ